MSEDRRVNDVRLALIEQKLDLTLKSIEEKFDTLTSEVRKYNGIREKLENACNDVKEHKDNHWKFATLLISVVIVIVSIASFLRQ